MSYDDFLRHFAQVNRINGGTTELLSKHYEKFSYQINCKNRGIATVNTIKKYFQGDIYGKKVLDIGCAYAGTSVAFAESGASVIGVEISEAWLKLGLSHIEGYNNISLIHGDASSKKILSDLGGSYFDIVLLEDVFEHVYDTYSLLENIYMLTKQGSIIYFNIPNGYFPGNIASEVHKKILGLSLVSPDRWADFGVGSSFSIFYRPWEYYSTFLSKFRFSKIDRIWISKCQSKSAGYMELSKQFLALLEAVQNSAYCNLLSSAFDNYKKLIEYDYLHCSDEEFSWKYLTPSWRGIVERVDGM